MCCLRIASTALLLLTAGSLNRSVLAQSISPQSTVNPREDADMRFGPFYVTPTFQLRNLGYDSNVFNSPEDPQGDFTATAEPHLEIWVPMARRALITTSGGAGFVYFGKFVSERSIDPQISVRGDLFLRRVTLFAEDSYLMSRQRPNLEIDARSRRFERSPTAGAIIQIGSRFSAEIAGYQRRLEYDQDEEFLGTNLSQALNQREDGARLTLRHRLTSFTTLVLEAESQRSRFESSPERDTDGFRIAPGFEFSPRALISGSADIGVRKFATKDPTLPDFTGIVATTTLAYTRLQTTVFGFTWDRDVNYSFEPTQPYYVANTLGGQIRRQIRGRVDASIGAQRAVLSYRSFDTATPVAPRTDVTTSYSADIGYRMNRTVRLSFDVTATDRRSPANPGRSYRSTRAGVSVLYVLPG